MAALPADLPFGCRLLRDDALPGPASHDGAGNRFVLIVPEGSEQRFALDVERRDLAVPEALAQALGGDAMRRWGEIEVMAKLLDQPAHLMLRRVLSGEGAALIRDNSLEIRRCDTAELWLVLGRRPVICR